MKKYNLKILFPTSNRINGCTEQYFNVTIYAADIKFENESIIFYDDKGTVAVYPSRYTIIQYIDCNP